MERLAIKNLFSKLDLKIAFHHVFMDENSIKYKSFTTPLGQFELQRMPIGLHHQHSKDLLKRYLVIWYDQEKL